MSPEQAQGKPLDRRSDIFSSAPSFTRCCRDGGAFAGNSKVDVLSAVVRDDPPALRMAPDVERIVTRCLSKGPLDRYPAVAELKNALQALAAKPVDRQPSIAVLPFANLSADKEQEYFGDGLAEEIINALVIFLVSRSRPELRHFPSKEGT